MTIGKSAAARAEFFRELARLTGAGISVTHAAKLLGHGARPAAAREAAAEMERGLADGRSIAGALEPSLNPMELSVVQASEQNGKLAEGFSHLEAYYELLNRTQNRIRSAVLYPLFMLHAAVVLPALVGAVLSGGNVVAEVLKALVFLWALLLAGWLIFSVWTRRAVVSEAADKALGWLPAVGKARLSLALARWQTVLHFQVTGGQRMSDGLRRAGEASLGARLNAASQRAAGAVENGGTLAEALSAQPAFPSALVSGLSAAEYTGTLDVETLRLSREAMATAGWQTEKSAKLVCGVFYGVVLAFTAWQILKMASGYMGMYENFSRELGL